MFGCAVAIPVLESVQAEVLHCSAVVICNPNNFQWVIAIYPLIHMMHHIIACWVPPAAKQMHHQTLWQCATKHTCHINNTNKLWNKTTTNTKGWRCKMWPQSFCLSAANNSKSDNYFLNEWFVYKNVPIIIIQRPRWHLQIPCFIQLSVQEQAERNYTQSRWLSKWL